MKTVIQKITEGQFLSHEEARNFMFGTGTGEIQEPLIAAVMTALHLRGIRLEELNGFRNALMELSLPFQPECGPAIDVCGTGGDGKNTFNISTATAFTLASMGYKVIKHGNHGVSSFCGSSTVLETLGYRFSGNPDVLRRQLDEHNLCFLHAPLFHPALARVAGLRRYLGFPSFFNCMGPLINPADPELRLTGTYSLELAQLYRFILRADRKRFHIVHGLNGFDELTFCGPTRVFGNSTDGLIEHTPEGRTFSQEMIYGGRSPGDSANCLTAILCGKAPSEHLSVVAGNAALGIRLFEPETTFETAYEKALEELLSGRPATLLQKQLSHKYTRA